jgi:hypothetical protein
MIPIDGVSRDKISAAQVAERQVADALEILLSLQARHGGDSLHLPFSGA